MKMLLSAVLLGLVFCGCRTTYLVTDIASGEVGGGVRLRNRYRVVACDIVRHDDLGWFWDSKLRVVASERSVTDEIPQLVAMYPGVFSSATDAVDIKVSIRVIGTDEDGDKAKCQLEIRDGKAGKPLGDETFFLEQRDMYKSELSTLHDVQSYRPIHVDQAYRKTVIEGFGGAVAAALEKYENGGVRVRTEQRPPMCVLPVAPMEKSL